MAWGAVSLLARSVVRRRWAALLAVALMLGTGGTFFLASLAGAQRTQTAAVRAFTHARTADVSLDISGLDRQRLAAVRALPGVGDLSVFGYTPVRPVGSRMVRRRRRQARGRKLPSRASGGTCRRYRIRTAARSA